MSTEPRETIEIETDLLRALFDLATGSMDFGSGFLDQSDVEALRKVAKLLGVDPLLATPSNFTCQYRGVHEWTDQVWGGLGGPGKGRYCRICRHFEPKESA